MQVIASSLGVSCNYCHARRGGPPAVTASGKSRQDVAREMIAMTRALNATVQTAAGKPANETVPGRSASPATAACPSRGS